MQNKKILKCHLIDKYLTLKKNITKKRKYFLIKLLAGKVKGAKMSN